MHPRNPYAAPPDFLVLADAYPALKAHLVWPSTFSHGCTIDFKDDASQRCLTEALLSRDFGIQLQLPNNRLCPPIPNRLNYVLWIQDIIRAASLNHPAPPVRGIDIGTGASAIYPLLTCKLESNWEFVVTEIDDASAKYAQLNIDDNNLSDRIKVLRAVPEGPLFLPLSHLPISFDFTMCNPPFYSSAQDIAHSAGVKELAPKAVCTGADVEMITPGGESAFVRQMVIESLIYKRRCQWYTSMLGKMSSLFDVVSLLRKHSINNYAITEFIQGQTRRWAIAWSFGDIHLPDSIARIPNRDLQSVMPPRNTIRQSFPRADSARQLNESLHIVLSAIDGVTFSSELEHQLCENSSSLTLVQANGNTWSRAARRKQNSGGDSMLPSTAAALLPDPPLSCRIWVLCTEDPPEKDCFDIRFQWLQGSERSLYDSFCSHVSRKIATELEMRLH